MTYGSTCTAGLRESGCEPGALQFRGRDLTIRQQRLPIFEGNEIGKQKFRDDQVCGSMKPRHLKCLAHFGDPPDGSIDVRESVYMYIYKENIVREHLTGPQHYPDNGLVSGTRGEVSRNQEEVQSN
ncbi:hypothetical protein AVEN_52486-1 [Araneus ventricosus]|uniref:Uncharacterized protein n=1 Tax=Araneus ventricosus TaxID=182803 RepID=A0A4Y2CW90_ARAVE|nr:hypothetical protein AVEN_52486-1 [Araneus ventricosus]